MRLKIPLVMLLFGSAYNAVAAPVPEGGMAEIDSGETCCLEAPRAHGTLNSRGCTAPRADGKLNSRDEIKVRCLVK